MLISNSLNLGLKIIYEYQWLRLTFDHQFRAIYFNTYGFFELGVQNNAFIKLFNSVIQFFFPFFHRIMFFTESLTTGMSITNIFILVK